MATRTETKTFLITNLPEAPDLKTNLGKQFGESVEYKTDGSGAGRALVTSNDLTEEGSHIPRTRSPCAVS